ncbi:MAG: lactate permease LctP family transporter [Bryobacterales bacterium]|nr:lactate permease LctP family transporter [Bryobacterales bacterium]
MWRQNYTPVADSLALSALVAAAPIFVLLYLLGVKRRPAWVAALSGLATAAVVALAAYGMPAQAVAAATSYGAAFGLFPIGWVVFCAILLYRITVETGKFEIVKDSVGSLTDDRRLQALLIAFAFGAFIEGAAGFGTPVAVAAAMLAGLGFSPFYAAGICLLANTAPVAFGSIGTPILTLATVTGLPMDKLSAATGRICAPVSLIVPAYLVLVMGGWRVTKPVLPAVAACGISFAGMQFVASNWIGPQLTDILSSLASIGALVALLLVWKPRGQFEFENAKPPAAGLRKHSGRELALAWGPYAFLVVLVLLWGWQPVRSLLNSFRIEFAWPGLHGFVERMPPVTPTPSPYPAIYNFNWLAASGTACLLAAVLSALLLRVGLRQFARIFWMTCKQLALPELTIAAVLGLAFLMNYSGATATLGLAFAATGVLFPFFSAMLGWLGVFLTGSDTSANALFGNLQVITAGRLGFNPVLMAASNSAGGVMGKMISLQSIAVAAAATSMARAEEGRLFRFTLRHSILLASLTGLVTVFYAYIAPAWAPSP